MRELLSQKEQRQLKILEYLFENPIWMTYLKSLATMLESSRVISKNCAKSFPTLISGTQLQES